MRRGRGGFRRSSSIWVCWLIRALENTIFIAELKAPLSCRVLMILSPSVTSGYRDKHRMITVIACPGASSQFPPRSTSSPHDLNAMQCTRKPSTKPNATHHYQSWVIFYTPSAPKPCMRSNHTENLREDEGVERSVREGGKEEGARWSGRGRLRSRGLNNRRPKRRAIEPAVLLHRAIKHRTESAPGRMVSVNVYSTL